MNTTELDLAILDIMLPEIGRFTLCQKIRSKYTYPVASAVKRVWQSSALNLLFKHNIVAVQFKITAVSFIFGQAFQ